MNRLPTVDEYLADVTTEKVTAAELLNDRHDPAKVAFTCIDADLNAVDLTYGELRERSEKVASALSKLGVQPGDHVATLMSKSPDMLATLLGIWRLGAVDVPLFTAFAWTAIELRLTASGAKVVVVDADQRPKIQETSASVVVAGSVIEDDDAAQFPEDLPLGALLAAEAPGFPAFVGNKDTPLVLIFTSGTTGHPKGVPVPIFALAAFRQYIEASLDVREEDVFWNAADPGWALGLYYGVLGVMVAGKRNLFLRSGFDAKTCFAVMEKFKVNNFLSAPTMYRSLRAAGVPAGSNIKLRRASSAGEPLTPEVSVWTKEHLGSEVMDQYGQTELGMFIVNAWADELAKEPRPLSMGHALPGFTCAVLENASDNIAGPNTAGRVAVNVKESPLAWFSGYKDAPERTAQRFSADGTWYYTGDAGRRDEDGYFYFQSRDDDIILMAGYRIGPFDVESVLATHPAVQESAVVGEPDEIRGEVVVAYVVLAEGNDGSDDLAAELKTHVKTNYSAHAYPRKVNFVPSLPKTPSGKIQRFILREQAK